MYSVQLTLEVLGSKAATRGRRQCSVQLTLAVLGSTELPPGGEGCVVCIQLTLEVLGSTAYIRGVLSSTASTRGRRLYSV